jgi:hypothetical protein
MDPGRPGCTPLFGIGALQERTKPASDTDHGTKSEPGMSDPRSATRFGVKQLPSASSTGWLQFDNPDARSNLSSHGAVCDGDDRLEAPKCLSR